jgi:hypothetical protein
MADDPNPERGVHATSFLRSIGEGVRTILTVTERLNDLRVETKELHEHIRQLANELARSIGRLEGIEQRFAEVDKRIDLAVRLAVREQLDRNAASRE